MRMLWEIDQERRETIGKIIYLARHSSCPGKCDGDCLACLSQRHDALVAEYIPSSFDEKAINEVFATSDLLNRYGTRPSLIALYRAVTKLKAILIHPLSPVLREHTKESLEKRISSLETRLHQQALLQAHEARSIFSPDLLHHSSDEEYAQSLLDSLSLNEEPE